MNKGRKKIDRARSISIKWVANKSGYSQEYVRGIVNGTFSGGNSEEVMRMYRAKYKEIKEVLA